MSKTIVKAAIKVKDETFTGFDHGECFKFARDKFPIPVEDLEQGFIDSDGNFVDRKQAMIIAKEAGQLRYEPSKRTLISEDLHIDWLNKQKQIIDNLEQEQIAEMKEHQEAMQVADQRIKELEEELKIVNKALKLASEHIWGMSIWENTKDEVVEDNIKFFKDRAELILFYTEKPLAGGGVIKQSTLDKITQDINTKRR